MIISAMNVNVAFVSTDVSFDRFAVKGIPSCFQIKMESHSVFSGHKVILDTGG